MPFHIILLSLIFLFSCSKDSPEVEQEIFNDSDRPFFQYNSELDYYYCEPWNYNKNYNNSREYPLVIYLHGWGGKGLVDGLNFIGYDDNDGYDDATAKKFQSEYPSFVFIPQTEDTWEGELLIDVIENFKRNYRIDESRIYLIGYSMGSYGSYLLANAYYDYNKLLFAGIIWKAGHTETVVRDKIARETSFWFHVGVDDSPDIVDTAREAYNFLKSKNPDGNEVSSQVNIDGITGTTVSFVINGNEKFKKTEYNNTGHSIEIFPFHNDSLIEWLFNQEL